MKKKQKVVTFGIRLGERECVRERERKRESGCCQKERERESMCGCCQRERERERGCCKRERDVSVLGRRVEGLSITQALRHLASGSRIQDSRFC